MSSILSFLYAYFSVLSTHSIFIIIPTYGLFPFLLAHRAKEKERKEYLKNLGLKSIGLFLAISYVTYFSVVLPLHHYELYLMGNSFYVPKEIFYTVFSVESVIWFDIVGFRYAGISFNDLLKGELKNVDKRRLFTGMLISLLWIPLITAMIAVG